MMQRTVESVKAWINAKVSRLESVECPCCEQKVSAYKVSLTGSMVRTLRFLSESPGFVHLPSVANRFTLTHNDHAKMRHWNLVEGDPNETGSYRITPRGRMWLAGTIKIPAYVYVSRGKKVWGSDALEMVGPDEVDFYRKDEQSAAPAGG